MLFILAQTDPKDVKEGVDLLERISRGSVAFILLCLLVLAIIGFVWQYRRNIAIVEKQKDADDKRAAQDRADAQKALSDSRADADKNKSEQLALMRERVQADKELDTTLAASNRVLDKNTSTLERNERVLARVESLLERLERRGS
jgi:hypothetical protein